QTATAQPTHPHHRRHRRRVLHADLTKPVLIHRPTSDDRAILGAPPTFTEALTVLKRALDDDAVMAALPPLLAWGGAQLLSEIEVLARLARAVAGGRMIIVNRPPAPKVDRSRYEAALDKTYRALLAGPLEGGMPYLYLDS